MKIGNTNLVKFKLLPFLLLLITFCQAQEETLTLDELKTLSATKSEQLKSLQKEVDGLNAKIASQETQAKWGTWDLGMFGTLGFNFSNFSDWLPKETPNVSAANIGVVFNGLANYEQEKYFWKNSVTGNLGWLKFDNKDKDDDETGFQVSADAFNASSLFGWKITKTLALSLLGEYRTSLLNGTLNNPSYLDLGGGGLTWTPTPDFRAVLHSLNFNWVFAKEDVQYESSLGAKIVVDYTKRLPKGIAWKTNFSTFISYEDVERLSNWVWMNTFTTAYKGIGIGFDLGLRGNKQEALALELPDNPVQMYWLLGVSYNLATKK